MSENREQLIDMTKQCLEEQQYKNMLEYVKQIVINYEMDFQYKKEGGKIVIDERSLFQKAFFHTINDRIINLSLVREIQQDEEQQGNFKNQKLIQKQQREIENEIIQYCKEGIKLLDEYFLKRLQNQINDNNIEQKVFYLKLKADFNRYMCEVYGDSCSGINDKEYKQLVEDTFLQYQRAHDIAIDQLQSTNIVRLSLGHNFSKFYYYQLNQIQEAFWLKKSIFDEAVCDSEGLDVSQPHYEEIMFIVKELKQEMTLSADELEQNQLI